MKNIFAPFKLSWQQLGLITIAGVTAWLLWTGSFAVTITFVLKSMIDVTPLVLPGILMTSWVAASGAGAHIRKAIEGKPAIAIITASIVGAITPVCGITVLPLMTGLLASGVPLAPVIAFWLSSPVTDPAMFAVTAATLGYGFALGKTIAAFLIGLMGGAASLSLSKSTWIKQPLRETGLTSSIANSAHCDISEYKPAIWNYANRRRRFLEELWNITKLIVIVLSMAFAAEYLMQQFLDAETLSKYVGKDSSWGIPLSVFVGAPAYLNGYAALPLTRGLIEHGMSSGAAMAFLVSGSVVSIWGAMAIFPILRLKPFLLYLILAIIGSLLSGYIFEFVA